MGNSVVKIFAAAWLFVMGTTLSAPGQTSVDFAREAEAIVIVGGAEYRFAGNCQRMARGHATQMRMTVPGSGPNGEHVQLAIFASTFAPTQFTIYAGLTPEAARDASLIDDRSGWHVRGGASQEAIEFAPTSLSAAMTASIWSNGEKTLDETSIQLDITGC